MENKVDVKFGADTGELNAKLQEATNTVRDSFSSINGALDSVTATFFKVNQAVEAFKTVLSGGEIFSAAIQETMKLNTSMEILSLRLGKSLGDVFALADTLEAAGSSGEAYGSAIQRMTMRLLAGTDAFTLNGIAVTDLSGKQRDSGDILQDTIAKINSMTNEGDRQAAGIKLLGRSWSEYMVFQYATKEAVEQTKKAHEELGFEITNKSVAATRAYMGAMNDAQDVFQSVALHVTNALLPGLTALSRWFASVGPDVVVGAMSAFATFRVVMEQVASVGKLLWDTLKSAFSGIGAALSIAFGGQSLTAMDLFKVSLIIVGDAVIAFKTGFVIAFDLIGGALRTVALSIGMFAAMATAALSGDFSGVKAIWKAGMADIAGTVSGTVSKISDEAGRGIAAMDALAASVAKTDKNSIKQEKDKPKGPGGAIGSFFVDPKDGDAKQESGMAGYENQLLQARILYAETHNLRALSKEDEEKFWSDILAGGKANAADRLAIQQKLDQARLASLLALGKETQQIDTIMINSATAASIAMIDNEGTTAATQLALGQITANRHLQIQRDLEIRKFAIIKESNDKINLLSAQSGVGDAAAISKQESAYIAHTKKMADIDKASAIEHQKDWLGVQKGIESGFTATFTKLMSTQIGFVDAIKSLMQNVLDAIINFLAKTLAEDLASGLISKAMNVGKVLSASGVAGANAVASTAAAPYPLNLSAPAVGASMAAAAAGYASVASAESGYDIPAGVNPLTQLHEREMVLPAQQADVIRNLSSGGGGGGANVTNNFTFSTQPDQRTQAQVAAMVGMAVRRAVTRNG